MAGIITEDTHNKLKELANKLEGAIEITKAEVEINVEDTVQGILSGHAKYIRGRTEAEVRRDTVNGKVVEIAAKKMARGSSTVRYHYDFIFDKEYRVEVKRINKEAGFKYLRNDKQRLDTFINHHKAIDFLVVGDFQEYSDYYRVIFDYVAVAYKFDKHYKDSMYSGPRYFNHKEAAKRKNAIILNEGLQTEDIVVLSTTRK